MGYLTREAVLAADDLPTTDVDVPEWGGSLRVRGLTGAERDQFEEWVLRGRTRVSLANVRARLVAMACVDEQGERLFQDADVEELGAKSGRALDRVFDVISRLSGLMPADVEALAKNLRGARRGASGSD